MNCKQNDRLYSLIHALRDCSFCTAPADLSTILHQMEERRALLPDNTPSATSVRRLLSPPLADDARQLRRTISAAEEFLSEEYNGFKELLLFQIIRRWKEDDTLTCDDSQIGAGTEQHTRRGLFHLTYRMDPSLVAADRSGEVPFVSDEDYQFRISARWQLILDLLASLPCLSGDDAAGLTSVLSRTCTLGEIPLRAHGSDDREHIDFAVLSRLTRYFQTAHKAAHLPTPATTAIPCMDITIGRYDLTPSGSLHLVPGETVTAYPVSTSFQRGIYYLCVLTPEASGFTCRRLRADHILDCAERADLPARTLMELGAAADPDCSSLPVECSHYTVTDCPETALVEIIDAFGKDAISNCSLRTRDARSTWNFTVSLPTSQEAQLKAIHAGTRKM